VREGGAQYSSPVVADGNVYWTSRAGTVYVVAAGEEFQQLAANRFTQNESEWFVASPAIVDGQIFLRSSERLYCIAADAKVAANER
jgi:outer membrane protein assembly factor BamB